MARLPYGARSKEEMERNLHALGEDYQEIPRTWDERFGYVSRPVPLTPLVATGAMLLVVVGLLILLAGCAEVVAKNNCALYGYCASKAAQKGGSQ